VIFISQTFVHAPFDLDFLKSSDQQRFAKAKETAWIILISLS
jgi:hypothetical protein